MGELFTQITKIDRKVGLPLRSNYPHETSSL